MSVPSLFTNGRLLPTFLPSLPPLVRLLPACPSILTISLFLLTLLLTSMQEKNTRGRVYGKWRLAPGFLFLPSCHQAISPSLSVWIDAS